MNLSRETMSELRVLCHDARWNVHVLEFWQKPRIPKNKERVLKIEKRADRYINNVNSGRSSSGIQYHIPYLQVICKTSLGTCSWFLSRAFLVS